MSFRHLHLGVFTLLVLFASMVVAQLQQSTLIMAPVNTNALQIPFHGNLDVEKPLTKDDHFEFLGAVTQTTERFYDVESISFIIRKMVSENKWIEITEVITIDVKENAGKIDSIPLIGASSDAKGKLHFVGTLTFRGRPAIGEDGCRLTFVPSIDSMPNMQHMYGDIVINPFLSTLTTVTRRQPLIPLSATSTFAAPQEGQPIHHNIFIALQKITNGVSSLDVYLFGYDRITAVPQCSLNDIPITTEVDEMSNAFKVIITSREFDIPAASTASLSCSVPFLTSPQSFTNPREIERTYIAVIAKHILPDENKTVVTSGVVPLGKVKGVQPPQVVGQTTVQENGNIECLFVLGNVDRAGLPPEFTLRVLGGEYHGGFVRVAAGGAPSPTVVYRQSLDVSRFSKDYSIFPVLPSPDVTQFENTPILVFATLKPGAIPVKPIPASHIQCQLEFTYLITKDDDKTERVGASHVVRSAAIPHLDDRVTVVTHPVIGDYTRLLFRFDFEPLTTSYTSFSVAPHGFDFTFVYFPTKKDPDPFCLINNKQKIPVVISPDQATLSWTNTIKQEEAFSIRCPEIHLKTNAPHLRTLTALRFTGVTPKTSADGLTEDVLRITTVFFIPDRSSPSQKFPDNNAGKDVMGFAILLIIGSIVGVAVYFIVRFYKQRKLQKEALLATNTADDQSLDHVAPNFSLN